MPELMREKNKKKKIGCSTLHYLRFLFFDKLMFVIFLCFFCNPTWGLYIGFWEEDIFTYKFQSRGKTYKEDNGEEISKEKTSIASKKEDFKFTVKKTERKGQKAYEVRIIFLPKKEKLIFDIPENIVVVLKTESKILCNSIEIHPSTPPKKDPSKGKLINQGKIAVEKTLSLNKGVTLKNEEEIEFKNQTLLNLRNGFLINARNGKVHFQEEARILGPESLSTLRDPLLYEKHDEYGLAPLINNGLIVASQKIALFTEFFISEDGRIHSDEQIITRWNRKCPPSPKDFDVEIVLLKEDEDFPVLDIIRIPQALTNDEDLDPANLGEKTAIYFYEAIQKKKSLSNKANNQGNGIDVIAYGRSNKKQIVIHESKNYSDSRFNLSDKNQMTQSWIYGYLFKMYQNYLNKSVQSIQTGRSFLLSSLDEKTKEVLLNILDKKNAKILKGLVELEGKDLKMHIKKFRKDINDTLNKKISGMRLKHFKAYFSKNIDIISRGNSIVHCDLPQIKDYGLHVKKATIPTYFLRRDLSKRFEKRGKSPQVNG